MYHNQYYQRYGLKAIKEFWRNHKESLTAYFMITLGFVMVVSVIISLGLIIAAGFSLVSWTAPVISIIIAAASNILGVILTKRLK